MKKFLFVFFVGAAVTNTVALAQVKCDGGTVFQGIDDGHEYCIGNPDVTWWAAFAWCQRNGRHLASLQEACNWQGSTTDSACPNLTFASNINKTLYGKTAWTATPIGTDNAYGVYLGTGQFNTYNNGQYRRYIARPICF